MTFEFLTVAECAKRAGVSAKTIRREIVDGKLVSEMRYGMRQVSYQAWDNYLRACHDALPRRQQILRVRANLIGENPEQDLLLQLDSIKAKRVPPPFALSGIYFLFKGDEIVYIGQATNVMARVACHIPGKDFDSYASIPCPREQLNEFEHRAIIRYQPKLNLR